MKEPVIRRHEMDLCDEQYLLWEVKQGKRNVDGENVGLVLFYLPTRLVTSAVSMVLGIRK